MRNFLTKKIGKAFTAGVSLQTEVSQHKGNWDSPVCDGQDRKRVNKRERRGREKAMPVQSWPGSLQSGIVSYNNLKVDWP